MKILTSGCLYRNLLEYDDMLESCFEIFGSKSFARIMCGSFACRLAEPGYIEMVMAIREDLGSESFARIMCDSFACRLADPGYIEMVMAI